MLSRAFTAQCCSQLTVILSNTLTRAHITCGASQVPHYVLTSPCASSLLGFFHLASILQPTSSGPKGGVGSKINQSQLNKTSHRAPVPPATP